MKKIISLFYLVLVIHFSVITASAHKVILFAYVEGDIIYTESKFSGGRKAKNCKIFVHDENKNLLYTGTTDENGKLDFKIPKITTLNLTIEAGTGHKGYWTIPVEEIKSTDIDISQNFKQDSKQNFNEIKEQEKTEVSINNESISLEDIEKIVEKTMDKKLKPVYQILIKSSEKNPTANDIFGGIGYIFGLMGIAAYFYSKKKKN